MRMEIAICLAIISAIFILEVYTQGFTEKTVKEINGMFGDIEENIMNSDIEQMNYKIKDLSHKWEEKQKKLAYYIEHDELEKVHTAIVTMKSYIETENFSEAKAELDKGRYVIEHIQEKNAFNLQNIF